ncbi:MAG: hypothetical protein LC802_10900 [Acidobacteria bacterium]|nr:hypothetical protein [Acidobacteriota bacterium]
MIMEAGEKVTSTFVASAGAGALGSHQFLDDFALAYHLAVAERLRERPDAVIERARQNLNRWLEGDAFGPGERQSVEEWLKILDGSDAERLIRIITDPSDEGQRLRSSSPFVGALTPEERLEILAACEQRATA